ncbi:unnamed protein product [Camellia sinensis]
MKQKTSKDHNSQMVSSLEHPLLHTKLKEQFLKMVRVSATGMFSLIFKGLQNREQEDRVHVLLKTKNATELVAPAIVAGLGALTHTLGTIVPMIGASGLAIAAAATTTAIGIVVSSFR